MPRPPPGRVAGVVGVVGCACIFLTRAWICRISICCRSMMPLASLMARTVAGLASGLAGPSPGAAGTMSFSAPAPPSNPAPSPSRTTVCSAAAGRVYWSRSSSLPAASPLTKSAPLSSGMSSKYKSKSLAFSSLPVTLLTAFACSTPPPPFSFSRHTLSCRIPSLLTSRFHSLPSRSFFSFSLALNSSILILRFSRSASSLSFAAALFLASASRSPLRTSFTRSAALFLDQTTCALSSSLGRGAAGGGDGGKGDGRGWLRTLADFCLLMTAATVSGLLVGAAVVGAFFALCARIRDTASRRSRRILAACSSGSNGASSGSDSGCFLGAFALGLGLIWYATFTVGAGGGTSG